MTPETRRAPSIDAPALMRLDINSRHLCVQPKPHTFFPRVQHESHHHAVRIDKAVRRTERAAENVVHTKLRHHLNDVVRSHPFNVRDAQGILPFAIRFQIGQMVLVGRAEQITMRAIIRWVPDHFIEL